MQPGRGTSSLWRRGEDIGSGLHSCLRVAPTRPLKPARPFDRAYRLADLDELVRGAQRRGIEVLLTMWGTPAWANGGAGENLFRAAAAGIRSGNPDALVAAGETSPRERDPLEGAARPVRNVGTVPSLPDHDRPAVGSVVDALLHSPRESP